MSYTGADDTPAPRLCHVKKWDDFNGYGFNLHAEKGKAGQFIGKVDENSPAEAAGLKEGDRIVEVNGTNIGNENHQQVVQRVKAVPNETKLLVVDSKADSYYKEQKIVVRGDMAEVVKITCPDTSSGKPTVEGDSNGNTAPSAEAPEPVSESPSKPRQCHLKIWSDFAGYGFNLHAEKGKPGQYIGKVDELSPAEMAGLKEGDRIVEVNEKPINQDNHQQVVQKIKEYPSHTKLLVVDAAADKYYRDNDILVTSSLPEVVTITCPDSKEEAAVNGSAQVEAEVNHDTSEEEAYEDAYEEQEQPAAPLYEEYGREELQEERLPEPEDGTAQQAVVESESAGQEVNDQEVIVEATAASPGEVDEPVDSAEVNGEAAALAAMSSAVDDHTDETPEIDQQQLEDEIGDYEVVNFNREKEEEVAPEPEPAAASTSKVEEKKEEPVIAKSPTPPPPAETPTTPVSPGPVTIAGIEFAGSVAEAKARASRKKRSDPRADTSMTMKDKYDMFQRL